jgi:hypothetical protein
VKPGNAMPLRSMPVGTIIHNVELKPGKGGQMARSAGTYAQLVGRDAGLRADPLPRASCAWFRPLHGHDRRGVEPGPQNIVSARPAAPAGWAIRPTCAASR